MLQLTAFALFAVEGRTNEVFTIFGLNAIAGDIAEKTVSALAMMHY